MRHYLLYVMMFLIASIAGNSMASGQTNVTVSLTVKSVDLSGNPLNGMWTELYFDGKLIASGFTPVTFTVNSGSQYSIAVADFQDIAFNHWEDGSTNRFRTLIPTQNTIVTAFYSTGGTSNNPPIAANDSVTTSQNKQITINVLANDSDPDRDSLTVDSVTTPSSGTAVINPDDTITYVPNGDFVGSDSFIYTISDTKGATDSATVSVTVSSSGGTQLSIMQIKSGLVASDPLNNATLTKAQLKADTRYWTYGGSAEGFKPPAPFDFFQNSTGRYIGVQAPASGTYAGYYAVTPPAAKQVDVVDASGTILASSQITNGAALIDVGKYNFPLAAQIIVYDSNGISIASTSASIFGGDVYSVN